MRAVGPEVRALLLKSPEAGEVPPRDQGGSPRDRPTNAVNLVVVVLVVVLVMGRGHAEVEGLDRLAVGTNGPPIAALDAKVHALLPIPHHDQVDSVVSFSNRIVSHRIPSQRSSQLDNPRLWTLGSTNPPRTRS